jgi:hypothetical protein
MSRKTVSTLLPVSLYPAQTYFLLSDANKVPLVFTDNTTTPPTIFVPVFATKEQAIIECDGVLPFVEQEEVFILMSRGEDIPPCFAACPIQPVYRMPGMVYADTLEETPGVVPVFDPNDPFAEPTEEHWTTGNLNSPDPDDKPELILPSRPTTSADLLMAQLDALKGMLRLGDAKSDAEVDARIAAYRAVGDENSASQIIIQRFTDAEEADINQVDVADEESWGHKRQHGEYPDENYAQDHFATHGEWPDIPLVASQSELDAAGITPDTPNAEAHERLLRIRQVGIRH